MAASQTSPTPTRRETPPTQADDLAGPTPVLTPGPTDLDAPGSLLGAPERARLPAVRGTPSRAVIDACVSDPARRFGRYVLLGELGHGGMGLVYQGWDPAIGRIVAIKVLRADAAWNAEGIARFQREARAAGRLRHEGIVSVFDVGEHAGDPFIVMDYIEGETLSAVLRRGASPVEIARLVAAIARAVHHAHGHGIVHRDLKPGNVLIDGEGRPLVTDFGLARDAESASELTRLGDALGTPIYMAPEQASGDSADVGPRADVWALGAILYRAFCGRPPFLAKSDMALLVAIVEGEPDPPRRIRPDLSTELEALILKALAKSPDDRPASAEALAEALEELIATDTLTGVTRSVGGRGATAAVAVAAGLIALAGSAFWLATLPSEAPAVRLVSPAADAVVGEATVRVEGRVEGSPEELWLGRTLLEVREGRFVETVHLPDGRHHLVVTATPDGEPLVAATVVVDTAAPVLELDAPLDRAATGRRVLVRGRIADANPPAVVRVGSLDAPVEPDGSFSVELDLDDGDQTIVVVAADAAGHEALVRRDVVVDGRAPQVRFDPALPIEIVHGKDARQIQAIVRPDEPGCRLTVNDHEKTLRDDGTWNLLFRLQTGPNRFRFVVSDAAGNETRFERTLTWFRNEPWWTPDAAQVAESRRSKLLVSFENELGMKMALIPTGMFAMGSPADEAGRADDELAHEVTLTRPVFLSATEVRNRDYRRFRPGHRSADYRGESTLGEDQPVVAVSWNDAVAFCDWLNGQRAAAGKKGHYRLPTEAEWEWAARAGTIGATFFAPAEPAAFANLVGEADGHLGSAPVGSFRPNAFGLHDTIGNAWEWTTDRHGPFLATPVTDPGGPITGEDRVLRGGAWLGDPIENARSARRLGKPPGTRAHSSGFRLAFDPPRD